MLRCSWIALALLGALGCGAGSAKDGAQVPPRSSRPLAPELREVGRAVGEQRFEDGRALAQKYVAAHPQDGQGHYIQGMTYYWTGNFGAARAGLERALELEPGITIAHESLGYCLFMLGDLGAARREYEAYLASAPREPKGHYGLGLIELEEARLTEAEACFRRAIELFGALDSRALAARQPEFAECHARLGEVHFARDELAAARAEFELATRICPGNISAFYTLSLVYRRLGEAQLADQAAATYESARQALVAAQKAKGE